MSQGITVAPDSASTFGDLKSNQSYRYIIYKMNSDRTSIIVDKTSQDGSYDDLTNDLPETECRWAVYDFRDESKASGIVFLSWAPDNARLKEKMLFTSSQDTLRRALGGVSKAIQATEFSEIDYEIVMEKLAK